jgi:tRNA(Ile)-lysidine synthase
VSQSTEPFSPERLLVILQNLPMARVYWVGFSGGADSTALLHAMATNSEYPGPRLKALHVNHGLHPDADSWEARCAAFCRRLGVEFVAKRIEVDPLSGEGPEAEARHQRYSVVEDMLGGDDMFLTAHHLDDQAETLLLNLVRGSGVDGLAGMPATRPLGKGLLARPLLAFPMCSLRDYLKANGLDWIEDPTNEDPAFDRNFVRSHLLPLMEQRWRGAANNLARSSRLCRAASTVLGKCTDSMLDERLDHPRVLDIDGLDSGGEEFGLVLRRWVHRHAAKPIPHGRLEELRAQVGSAGPDSKVCIGWGDWSIHLFDGRLWLICGEAPGTCPERDWLGEETLGLGADAGMLALDPPAALPFNIRVRARAGGDRIRPAGSDSHRTIKDILRELRVPTWLRSSVPVLCRADRVLAIADLVISAELAETLDQLGSRLRWHPGDPMLQFVFGKSAQGAVDRAPALR